MYNLGKMASNLTIKEICCTMQAFADAYTVLENELSHLSPSDDDSFEKDPGKLLPKIIPSINHVLKI